MDNLLPCDNVGYRKRKISKTLLEELRPVFHQQSRTAAPTASAALPKITFTSEEKQKVESPTEIIDTIYKINSQERATLNIGGVKHEIKWELLEKYPKTRLGQLRKRFLEVEKRKKENEGVDPEKLREKLCSFEFWFDCQPRPFEMILNFYRKGKLHFEDGLCPVDFTEDLRFWGMDDSYFSSCCLLKFQKKRKFAEEEMRQCDRFCQDLKDDDNYKVHDGTVQNFLWNAFERPSHWMSKVTTYISTFFIVLSTFNMSISTIPSWQRDPCRFLDSNETNTTVCRQTFLFFQNLILPSDYNLPILENVLVTWFTLEYILRLYVSRDKRKFFASWLNTVDLMAILPFYLTLALKQIDINLPYVQCLLIFRVLRMFKLARQSHGLYCLGVTFRKSSKQLGILLLFLCITSIVFSSLVYIAEKENPDDFHSIPDSMWWAVITMTTVGYGDVVPKTILGKVVGCMAAALGLVIISLPVASIVSNFSMSYDDKAQRESVLKLKYEQSKRQNIINSISSTLSSKI